MVKDWDAPLLTLVDPEGDMEPFAPAEASIVKPATQAPAVQVGLVGSLAAHWAPDAQPTHVFVAWLQMGASPVHCESSEHPRQAPDPDGSQ